MQATAEEVMAFLAQPPDFTVKQGLTYFSPHYRLLDEDIMPK